MKNGAFFFPPFNARLLYSRPGKGTAREALSGVTARVVSLPGVRRCVPASAVYPSGVTYIKFSKTSEAAFALEEMNGKMLGSVGRPIKVMIASK